jgi:hypothetical protein
MITINWMAALYHSQMQVQSTAMVPNPAAELGKAGPLRYY